MLEVDIIGIALCPGTICFSRSHTQNTILGPNLQIQHYNRNKNRVRLKSYSKGILNKRNFQNIVWTFLARMESIHSAFPAHKYDLVLPQANMNSHQYIASTHDLSSLYSSLSLNAHQDMWYRVSTHHHPNYKTLENKCSLPSM